MVLYMETFSYCIKEETKIGTVRSGVNSGKKDGHLSVSFSCNTKAQEQGRGRRRQSRRARGLLSSLPISAGKTTSPRILVAPFCIGLVQRETMSILEAAMARQEMDDGDEMLKCETSDKSGLRGNEDRVETSIDSLLRDEMGAEPLTDYLLRTAGGLVSLSPLPSSPPPPHRSRYSSQGVANSTTIKERMHRLDQEDEVASDAREHAELRLGSNAEGYPNKRHSPSKSLSPELPLNTAMSPSSGDALLSPMASLPLADKKKEEDKKRPALVKLKGRNKGRATLTLQHNRSYVAQLFEVCQAQGWPHPTFTSEVAAAT